MSHPSEHVLALFAGGDLGYWSGWRVRCHLASCEDCRGEVEKFAVARTRLRSALAGMPEDAEWRRLAAEMTANIHLGLEAGECVSQPRRPGPPQLTGWKPAMVLASALMVVLLAYWANSSKPVATANVPPLPLLESQGVMLETSAGGIELNDHGRVLTLKHPKDRDVTFSVTADTVRARYVDSESGQVTINNVYVQ
ncbi:MAG: hypothetical protein IANPNBLG_01020 [Bryobacteraceae bacterium]|nr:hypothetical protein [Bryobacteraceae bacterium]